MTDIEALIEKHGETHVKYAFSLFATSNINDTLLKGTHYPITVFLKQFESLLAASRAEREWYIENTDAIKVWHDGESELAGEHSGLLLVFQFNDANGLKNVRPKRN